MHIIQLQFSGSNSVSGHARPGRQVTTKPDISHSSSGTDDVEDKISPELKPSVGKFGCFPNILEKPAASNKLKARSGENWRT